MVLEERSCQWWTLLEARARLRIMAREKLEDRAIDDRDAEARGVRRGERRAFHPRNLLLPVRLEVYSLDYGAL